MSPTSSYHARIKPLASQAGGKVLTTHGYPSKPLDITLGIYNHSLNLFQACVKMKPIPGLVFVLSCACKYMRISYRAYSLLFLMLVNM